MTISAEQQMLVDLTGLLGLDDTLRKKLAEAEMEDAWDHFMDEVEDRKLGGDIDWRADYGEAVSLLENLHPKPSTFQWEDTYFEPEENQPTHEFLLELLDHLREKEDARLFALDTGSDSVVVLRVDPDKEGQFRAIVAKCSEVNIIE